MGVGSEAARIVIAGSEARGLKHRGCQTKINRRMSPARAGLHATTCQQDRWDLLRLWEPNEPTMELEVSYCSLFGLVTSDWSDKLIQSEQVGGRAHATQYIRFVRSCGGSDYCHDGDDDFSRDAYRRRCWQFEMLRQRWNRKSVLNVASVVVQCESECRPLATKLVSASTSGAAQQNARSTSPVTRSIGR